MVTKHVEIALVAIENAQEIATDVTILLNHDRYARALSLAVIGCEEAGKALLHALAALNLAPSVVAAFEKKGWHSPLLNHAFKQLAVEMIGGADAELAEYEMAAAGELPPYPSVERTARLLCGCGRTLEDMFCDAKGAGQAGRAWFDRIRSMLLQPAFLPSFETPDDEKMRGLYVDLDRPSGQPESVSQRDAAIRSSALKYTLSVLDHLRSSLKTTDEWKQLSSEVERVRDEVD
jgi:AbiV family abortive infection protein